MGFRDAIRSALRNYFTVSGRASRSEFWWFFLFYFLAIFLSLFAIVLASIPNMEDIAFTWILLFWLALIPPFLTVTARRLHDKGLTAWVMLLVFVPFGQVAILILCALPGDDGPNAYGPDPHDRPEPEADFSPSNIPRVEDNDQ